MRIYPVISGDHWERAFIRALLREKGFYAVGCETLADLEEWFTSRGIEVAGYFLDIDRTPDSSQIIEAINRAFPEAKGVFLKGQTKGGHEELTHNSLILKRPISVDEAVKRMIDFWVR